MATFQETLASRRTAYSFERKSVSDSILQEALFAASQAPCHKHTHPWKFYVIGKNTRQKLIPTIKRLADLKSAKKGSSDLEKGRNRAINKITQPPILIAVTSKRNKLDTFREKEDYAATVCALHNLVLSLWDNGVAAQWSTGSVSRDEESYRQLSIDFQQEEIIGFVKAGYSTSTPNVKKLPVDEITEYLE